MWDVGNYKNGWEQIGSFCQKNILNQKKNEEGEFEIRTIEKLLEDNLEKPVNYKNLEE